jgi:hypothetical protein
MKIIRRSAGRRTPGVSILCPDPRVNQPDRPVFGRVFRWYRPLRSAPVEQMYE